jgi:hypothetical protein
MLRGKSLHKGQWLRVAVILSRITQEDEVLKEWKMQIC